METKERTELSQEQFDQLLQALVHKDDPAGKMDLEQAGMLTGVAKAEIFGVPLGGAAIGIGLSALVGGLMDRFAPNVATGAMGKVLAAAVVANWGKRWLGKEAADLTALFLTADAVAEPVENIIGQITGWIQGATMSQDRKLRQDTIDYAPDFAGGNKGSALESFISQN